MRILSLHEDLEAYLKRRNLEKKFKKQKTLFQQSLFHPSLEAELLEPKHMRIWSFCIDRKYRALFIFHTKNLVEIIDINNHYQ